MADERVEGPPVERGEGILTAQVLQLVADLDDARRLFEQVAPADDFPVPHARRLAAGPCTGPPRTIGGAP